MIKLLLILLLFPLINIAQDIDGGGGEYNLYNHHSCLSKQDRIIICGEIKEN